MDGFVSLTRDKYADGQPAEATQPDYPPGTQLRIEGDKIDTLGLADAQRGDKVQLEGYAYVSAVESRDGANGEAYRCVTLQPTAIKIEPDEDDEHDAEKYDRLGSLLSPTS